MVVTAASPPPSAGRPHPTYKEMVVQALTELRDPGGSSRRVIAKYIADHFSGLPASHDALLSVHLRRLRSQGLLRMSGYSYLLSTAPRRPGRPRKNTDLLLPSSAWPPFPGVKRGPGRPPKNTTPLGLKRGPGRPPKNTAPVALKRGPGRPPKNAAPSGVKRVPGRPPKNTTPLGLKRGPGRPPKNTAPVALKRGPGRPPKNVAPSGVKRGPGRPPKNTTPLALKRGPGRPRKNTTVPMSLPHTATPAGKRGRGRPPKNAPILTAAPAVAPIGKRRPGRPPKSAAVTSSSLTGARRGRGRPPKALLPAQSAITNAPAAPSPVAGTRKHGRPPKEKRPPGSPTKDEPPLQHGSETSVDAATTKRGPGRPRKDRKLGVGRLKPDVVGQMTEAGVEAQLAQAADQDRHLPSTGSSLTEKRGRGRPRKRPLETGTAETGVAASVEKRGPGKPRKKNPSAPRSAETGYKRGRGRPRKENPSVGSSVETGNAASVGNKRGRGRPRKDASFGTEPAEVAVEVSRNLAESRPKNDDSLVSVNETETESVLSGERMEARPVEDAGGVLVSGEKASIAHVEAEGDMLGVDQIDSNLGNTSL